MKNWKSTAGIVVTLLVSVLAIMMEWGGMGAGWQLWTTRIFAIAVVVSNVLGLKVNVPKAKIAGVGMIIAGLLIGAHTAGCSRAQQYQTLSAVVRAGNATGKQLATVCKAKRLACVKAHGEKVTPERTACLDPCKKALFAWVVVIKPAANTSVGASFAAIETSRLAKKKDLIWLVKLQPGACGVLRAITAWRELLGAAGAQKLLTMLDGAKGLVCK